MADRLLLRLHSDGTASWLAQDAAGRVLAASAAGWPSAPALARAAQVVVLVPAEAVLLMAAPAVARQRAQLARALPFAIEERIAGAIEEQHVALPVQLDGDTLGVAVVARAQLAAWLARLAEAGVQPDALVPETLAMPFDAGSATLLIEGSRALLRNGAHEAAVADLAELPAWLAAAAPAALAVHDFRDAPALALAVPVASYRERQRDPLAFLAAHLAPRPALNLLQGEFAPRHRGLPTQRLWRTAALLAAAAVLLAFTTLIAGWLRDRAELQRLDTDMRSVLHTSFPQLDRVGGDPADIMRSQLAHLAGNGDDASLLPLLARIAPVLGGATRIAVRGIEYHNATLELSLRAPDVEALDLVRERLGGLGGLHAEVTSVSSADRAGGGVDGRLRVSGGKS